MSVSILYNAKRKCSISCQEKELISDIIKKYQVGEDDMNEWRGENFLMPQYNQFEPPILIEGSVEIGSYPDDYEREIEEVVRWCYCLTEISKILTESEWKVTFGDERLVYDLTVGFKLDKIPVKLSV